MDSGPIRVVIVGAGARGNKVFAHLIDTRPTPFALAAVVEPDDARREAFRARYGLPASRCFARLDEMLAAPRVADIAFVCTPDPVHYVICRAVSEAGYDVLLEKPIATNPEEVRQLLAVEHACKNRIFVAHVLRYAPFFRAVRRILREGTLGAPQFLHLAENIGHWHFAHSYVRGSWRRADQTAPIILTKSSHDLDIIPWLVREQPTTVWSTGGLQYFTPANQPEGAADRCTECTLQDRCIYSAVRFYVHDRPEWPFNVIATDPDDTVLRRERIAQGPYGRCVWKCDNDVCDHQTVVLGFPSGMHAVFSLHAHTADNTRKLTILCERGEIRGDVHRDHLEVSHFTGEKDVLRVEDVGLPVFGTDSHGGGDYELLVALGEHLRDGRYAEMVTSLAASVPSHTLAFLAEASRAAGGTPRPVPASEDG